MQIRVLPASKLPSIIFNYSLPELPKTLPLPHAWDTDCQRVVAEDLEVPQSVYAFDKATWISTVVQELTFDIAKSMVSVHFRGGMTEEWPIVNAGCISALQSMFDELRLAAEAEREQRLSGSVAPAPSDVIMLKSGKHKKSRSLLQFMSSLISPSTQTPAQPLESARVQIPELANVAEDVLRSNSSIRFRARSLLVDTYRRFVLGELKQRLPSTGYLAWVARTILSATTDQMAAIIENAGGVVPVPPPMYSCTPSVTRRSSNHLFYDEDDPADVNSLTETLSTETDGSSLHTPLSTPCGTESYRNANSSTCSSDAHTYYALQQHAQHLQRLLAQVDGIHRNEEIDAFQFSVVLEIRSKRRAWSNRALRGGSSYAALGFAVPRESSPLARFRPITPENAYQRRAYHSLSRRTAEFDVSSLFSVAEEEAVAAEEGRLTFPVPAVLDVDDMEDRRIEDLPARPPPPPPTLIRPRIRVRTLSGPKAPPTAMKNPLQHLFVAEGTQFGEDGMAEFTLAMDVHDLSEAEWGSNRPAVAIATC